MTFTAFRPVLVGNKLINLRQNKSFWAPEVTWYVFFFWSSNVSQTACVRTPSTTPTPASGPSTAARTCSTASLPTARYSPVWEGWRRVVFSENRSLSLLPLPPQAFVEMYDLKSDPHQLENIVKKVDPSVLQVMNQRLIMLQSCEGESCRARE